MSTYAEKSRNIQSKTSIPKPANIGAAAQLSDRRSQAATQKKLHAVVNNSQLASTQSNVQLKPLRPTSNRETQQPVQRMSIDNTDIDSELKASTNTKHVVATDLQAATAKERHTDQTFVTNANSITEPVNSDDHDFPLKLQGNTDKTTIEANVSVNQWTKTPGVGVDNDVVEDSGEKKCEIRAYANNGTKIIVDHFQLANED